MNTSKSRTAPAKADPSDDILDVIAAFENGAEDGSLDAMEEVNFAAEQQRKKQEWSALSPEERLRRQVGEAIFERLLSLEMRQSELARRMKKERAWITRVVQGRENLTLNTLTRLAAALDCTVADLLRATGNGVTPSATKMTPVSLP